MARLGTPWPRSYQGRIAVVIAVAVLAVTVGVQGIIRGVVNDRVRDAARQALQKQAQALADNVNAAPDADKSNTAADARNFLPNTRIRVTWPAPPGVYVNIVRQDLDIEASAQAGDVKVRLQGSSTSGGLDDWLILALVAAGVLVSAVIVWALASALARRLRRQAAGLAASAASVAAGDLTARVEETPDELGRVAAAFNAMAARLEAADERQKRFLADVAHELRTPITAIEGFAESLADGVAASEEDRREAVEFIQTEAVRLRELIRELRELTWLDLEPAPRAVPVDLAEAARMAAARFAAQADDVGVRIVGPAGRLTVITDPGHVETMLANLVANAIAATPAGGRITLTVGVEGNASWISVADTGVGIAPEHLPMIFDRLYRVDSARSRGQGGSGLGLAIVKRLAEVLGGSVEVESEVGRGSTFTVRLPGTVGASISVPQAAR
jgi:two-component system sensor histidine kinase BaeS